MSDYFRMTRHPETKEFAPAAWLDDYYGPHNYGVKFIADHPGVTYDANRFTAADLGEYCDALGFTRNANVVVPRASCALACWWFDRVSISNMLERLKFIGFTYTVQDSWWGLRHTITVYGTEEMVQTVAHTFSSYVVEPSV